MDLLKDFLAYLASERSFSEASLLAYNSDLKGFAAHLSGRGKSFERATGADVAAYLMELKDQGRSSATVNRKLAAIRRFYSWLKDSGISDANPADNMKSPKLVFTEPDYLTVEQIESVLDAPDESVKGLRDKAILELMYATGIRASEVVSANLSDINLKIGYITATSERGKVRMIPIGHPARKALAKYLEKSRPEFKATEDASSAFFVNFTGQRLTRQGIWKILKHYGEKAGLEKELTPRIIRSSFAVHMIQNGADLKTLQDILGSEDITATRIFLTFSKNRIMDVYDKAFPRA